MEGSLWSVRDEIYYGDSESSGCLDEVVRCIRTDNHTLFETVGVTTSGSVIFFVVEVCGNPKRKLWNRALRVSRGHTGDMSPNTHDFL